MSSCSLCGSINFFLEDGFYYCTLCQTQREDAREEVHDNYIPSQETQRRKVDQQKKNQKETIAGEELTSWEIYNVILKGFVDQMIALGASKDLKPIVLQLWVSYLARTEVAFHGKNTIRFNLAYKKRDVELLSGQKFDVFAMKKRSEILRVMMKDNKKEKKNKVRRNKKRKEPTQMTRIKRKLIEAELSQSKSQQDIDFFESSQLQSQSQTLENLTQKTEQVALLDRFALSKNSRSIVKVLKTQPCIVSKNEKVSLWKAAIHKYRSSGQNLAMSSLFGILQLGMAVSQQDAQIGDTIRWLAEGHLSENAKCFFDSYVKVPFARGLSRNRRMPHSTLRSNMKKIMDVLSIKSIPPPNFIKLTTRYCLELQLPDSLLEKVHRLLVLYPPKETVSENTSFEARAMSYIVIVLKLFFGLDGVTEKSLSDVADFVNRKLENEGENGTKYFSWTEWVQYIECRKTIIAHFHYPTRVTLLKEQFAQGESSTFFTHWRRRYTSNMSDNDKSGNIKMIFGENMKQVLDDLSGSSSDVNFEFPASLTPLFSYTNTLLQNNCNKLDSTVCKILRQSFVTHNLLHPEMFKKLSNYASITVQSTNLRSMRKIPFIQSSTLPSSFKNIPISTLVTEDDKPSEIPRKRKRSQLDESLSKITDRLLKKRLVEVQGRLKERGNEEVLSSETDGSNHRHFSLCNPFENYWYLHGKFYLCSKSVSEEEFDEVARKMFSSSFLWLLKECSWVIGLPPKNLYYEVANTEIMLL